MRSNTLPLYLTLFYHNTGLKLVLKGLSSIEIYLKIIYFNIFNVQITEDDEETEEQIKVIGEKKRLKRDVLIFISPLLCLRFTFFF